MKAASIPKTSSDKKRILILDDHAMMRHGLAHLINREADLTVCGEAGNAARGLAAMKSLRPDLVLADITLPGKSGLEFIKDAQVFHPEIPVLVISMHEESLFAERALRAGARGYIMKSEGAENLIAAIRRVLQGEVYASSNLTATILQGMTQQNSRPDDGRPAALTDREFEVFQLIGQGLSTAEVARRLNLSIKTVGTHRVHIKEKLNAKTATDLVKQAVQWVASHQLV